MININLLPPDIERTTRRRRRLMRTAGLSVAAGVLVLAGLFYTWQVMTLAYYREQVDLVNGYIQELRGAPAEEERLLEQIAELDRKKEVLAGFRSPLSFAGMLRALNRSVPDGVLLETYKHDSEGRITVTGWAVSLTDVANFMVALEETGRYTELEVAFPRELPERTGFAGLRGVECGGGHLYGVRPGETFYTLAQRFGLTVEDLIAANPAVDYYRLRVGQLIYIPDPWGGSSDDGWYTVRAGDTFRRVAEAQGLTYEELRAANWFIPDPSLIYAGEQLCLPRDGSATGVSLAPEAYGIYFILTGQAAGGTP